MIDPALASCHMLRLSAAVVRAVHGKPGSEPFWRCFFSRIRWEMGIPPAIMAIEHLFVDVGFRWF